MKQMILIGTSGWAYDHWKGEGRLYEEDKSSEELLSIYAGSFRTVEINNTFYQLPDEGTIEEWRQKVPSGFVFAVKANRYITHMKNLLEPEDPVERLVTRVAGLQDELGPILFQLPPGWHVNADRLANFINVLPQGYRYVFEFRHESWYADPIYEILENGKCAFCIHNHKDAPSPRKVTADFAYVRFHGQSGNYEGKYLSKDLDEWATIIGGWRDEGVDVYGYFNNDFRGHAVENAQELIQLVS